MPRARGVRTGKGCWSACRAVCPLTGKCWGWRIAACMPGGSIRPLWPVAGSDSCALIWRSRPVPLGKRPLTASGAGCRRLGRAWQGVGECFAQQKSRLCCTLLMQWEVGYEHPWIVLADVAPAEANVAWYGLRVWIEAGFKDVKGGGLGWHHSKMRDAGRVERLWLAMAVAMVWMVGVGSHADSQRPVACFEQLPQRHIARQRLQRAPTQPPLSRLSCLQRGRLVLLAALFKAEPLPLVRLVPEPWPQTLTPPKPGPKSSQQRQRQKRRERKKRQKAAHHRRTAA